MRASSTILAALPALAAALCPAPLEVNKTFVLDASTEDLSTISNFGNGSWIFPQTNMTLAPPTRVLDFPTGSVNETLVTSQSFGNGTWLLMWNNTANTSPLSLDGATIDEYTHTLIAVPVCGSKTEVTWLSAACWTGDEAVAQGYFSQLQNDSATRLIEGYGGDANGDTFDCASSSASVTAAPSATTAGAGGVFTILPIMTTATFTAANGTVVTSTGIPQPSTGISPGGPVIVGNGTNVTGTGLPVPTAPVGAAARHHAATAVVGLAIGLTAAMLVL